MPQSVKELQNHFYVEQEVEEFLETDAVVLDSMPDRSHYLMTEANRIVERKLREGYILYDLIDYGLSGTNPHIISYKQCFKFFRFISRGASSWPGINAPTPTV